MPSTSRSERIEARTTPEVLAVVRQAAEIQGRSLSDFVVSAAEEAAKKAIEDAHVIRLSAKAQRQFVEALLSPPETTDAMKRAADRHADLFGAS